jgi:hypothetical protein
MSIPGQATEWRIPLMVFDQMDYNNVTTARNVVSDYDFLMGLVQTRRQFVYREADRRWLLHALDFVWQPERLTADGRTFQGTFLLIARELR